jgi:CheY-like chemotaxis protein
VVSILSPFELSVRERLLALEVPFVLTRPISMLDILGVVSGQLTLGNERWEDSEDGILQSARSLEVLVADDAQTNRIILTELLRDAGHNVVCVENGVDMVSLVRDGLEGVPDARTFDIILTDVQMPLLDGLSASTQIRELEKKHNVAKRLPIVAVTAHAMTDETSRMRSFGVDDVVTKPLDPLRLGQVIQRLTGQPTGQDNSSSRQATPSAGITDTQLAELALRLWAKVAKRDTSVAELFGLSDDPVSPEDFQRVLDIADVIERSGNSVRRSLLIFSGFTESYKEQLQKLNEAKQAKSSEDLRFASHALKGLLLDVGARITGKLAGSIEQLCKEGDLASALDSVGLLTKQVLLVSRLISQIGDAAGGEEKKQARDHETEKKETGAETEQ